MKTRRNRMRRFFAFLIDFIILYLPCVLSTFILEISFLGSISILIASIAIIAFFVGLILRDYLFHGRSIGKRIFKLKVVDADTLSEPSGKQLIIKGLFLFLYLFDGLFLIASGKSLSERATCTIVLHEQQVPCANPSAYSVHAKASVKKRIIVAAATILCIFIPMFLIVSTALNAVKRQENYKIAHTYLKNSNAFAQTQAGESQITLTGYSSSTRIDSDHESAYTVVTFTFFVQGQQYQVICHRDGDLWYVCSDCTDFL